MTVEELIQILQTMPSHAQVILAAAESVEYVDEVEFVRARPHDRYPGKLSLNEWSDGKRMDKDTPEWFDSVCLCGRI